MGYSITVNKAPVDLGIAGIAPITVAPAVVILSEEQFYSLTPTAIAEGGVSNNGSTGFIAADAIDAVVNEMVGRNGKIYSNYLPATNSGMQQASAPSSFTFHQDSPSNTWTINHNLGYNPPGILVLDSAGNTTEYDTVTFSSTNSMVLTFTAPFGGQAIVG